MLLPAGTPLSSGTHPTDTQCRSVMGRSKMGLGPNGRVAVCRRLSSLEMRDRRRLSLSSSSLAKSSLPLLIAILATTDDIPTIRNAFCGTVSGVDLGTDRALPVCWDSATIDTCGDGSWLELVSSEAGLLMYLNVLVDRTY